MSRLDEHDEWERQDNLAAWRRVWRRECLCCDAEPEPESCPGCGVPKNNGEPGMCAACKGDAP